MFLLMEWFGLFPEFIPKVNSLKILLRLEKNILEVVKHDIKDASLKAPQTLLIKFSNSMVNRSIQN